MTPRPRSLLYCFLHSSHPHPCRSTVTLNSLKFMNASFNLHLILQPTWLNRDKWGSFDSIDYSPAAWYVKERRKWNQSSLVSQTPSSSSSWIELASSNMVLTKGSLAARKVVYIWLIHWVRELASSKESDKRDALEALILFPHSRNVPTSSLTIANLHVEKILPPTLLDLSTEWLSWQQMILEWTNLSCKFLILERWTSLMYSNNKQPTAHQIRCCPTSSPTLDLRRMLESYLSDSEAEGKALDI